MSLDVPEEGWRNAVGVVLAAGASTRLRSSVPKVLHRISGRPLVCYTLDALADIRVPTVVVTGHSREQVIEAVKADSWLSGAKVDFCFQEAQRGTAHAVACALAYLAGVRRTDTSRTIGEILGVTAAHCPGALQLEKMDVLVVYGDSPLISGDTLHCLLRFHAEEGVAATLLTFRPVDPRGYGRVIRGADGYVTRVVEEKDIGPAERGLREVVGSTLCFKAAALIPALHALTDENPQREYRLTDVVGWMCGHGMKVAAFDRGPEHEGLGVNTGREMAQVRSIINERILSNLMDQGVTVVDPRTTYVHFGVEVGTDTIIHPLTVLEGRTRVGTGCILGPGAHLVDCEIGDRVRVLHSMVENSQIGDDVSIGPYSHIRRGCAVEPGVRIGNFVEVKNSSVGQGTKVNHHCYIGDAVLGKSVNIGAGTVTVNYDGISKHRTVIEDGVFVGCNANLIAPVRLGAGSYVAAGSTVTREVPPEALAIARARQENKESWVRRRWERLKGGRNE